jgi:hypothetical protein
VGGRGRSRAVTWARQGMMMSIISSSSFSSLIVHFFNSGESIHPAGSRMRGEPSSAAAEDLLHWTLGLGFYDGLLLLLRFFEEYAISFSRKGKYRFPSKKFQVFSYNLFFFVLFIIQKLMKKSSVKYE